MKRFNYVLQQIWDEYGNQLIGTLCFLAILMLTYSIPNVWFSLNSGNPFAIFILKLIMVMGLVAIGYVLLFIFGYFIYSVIVLGINIKKYYKNYDKIKMEEKDICG